MKVNGKFKSEQDSETNVIAGTTLLVQYIRDISKFNPYPPTAIILGIGYYRASN